MTDIPTPNGPDTTGFDVRQIGWRTSRSYHGRRHFTDLGPSEQAEAECVVSVDATDLVAGTPVYPTPLARDLRTVTAPFRPIAHAPEIVAATIEHLNLGVIDLDGNVHVVGPNGNYYVPLADAGPYRDVQSP